MLGHYFCGAHVLKYHELLFFYSVSSLIKKYRGNFKILQGGIG